MSQVSKPIYFLLGPSGAGKSTLAAEIGAVFGFLHIEIDRWPAKDGIDVAGLRPEWEEFLATKDPHAIAQKIHAKCKRGRRKGAVLSFPGTLFLSAAHLDAARDAGVMTVILYGSMADCLNSFLKRERAMQISLGQEHWLQNNCTTYVQFSLPDVAAFRLNMFVDGKFRNSIRILDRVKKRAFV